MFSESFLQILILLALAWTALGAVTLVVLLLRDLKKRKLW